MVGNSQTSTGQTLLPTAIANDILAAGKQKRNARRVFQAARRPLRRLVSRARGGSDRANQGEHGSFANRIPSPSRTIPVGDAESLRSLSGGDDGSVAVTLERYLRITIVLLIFFCCGVWFPKAYHFLFQATEYVATAWATCVLLIVMAIVRSKRANQAQGAESEELHPLVVNRQMSSFGNSEVAEDQSVQSKALSETFDQPHSSLDKFYIVDTANQNRFVPNTEPFEIDNELFSGHMIVMIRTPDVDDGSSDPGTQQNARFSDYFRSKQRRWEMQWQVRLKKKPEGKVYFTCELEDPVKLGVVQRAFVGAAMAFVKKMNPSFHYSITGQKPEASGKFEKAHMAFTLETGMDRIVVTKPGQAPPTLGQTIEEDAEHMKWRKKTGTIEWNTDYVYTFGLWTAYFDFLQWKSMHFPGIRPFTLSSVVGPQPILLSVYTISNSADSDKHYQCDINSCVRVEISNSNEMNIGPSAKQWLAVHKRRKRTSPSGLRESGSSDTLLHLADSQDEEDDVDQDIFREEQTVAELGEGLYLRSGDPVYLKGSSQDQLNGFLSNGGGFAVVQNNSPATIVVEKAKPNKRRRNAGKTTSLIRSGDTVKIKLILRGSNAQDNVKYLSIHRGWWLKWVNQAPTKNGFFTIHTHETDVGPDGYSVSQAPQSSYVTLGGIFWLRHKRWERYQVGVGCQESATYGGRMLGLRTPDTSSSRSALEEELEYKSDEEDETASRPDSQPDFDELETQADEWMKPLVFTAHQLVAPRRLTSPKKAAGEETRSYGPDGTDRVNVIHLTTGNCSVDVPVWIEMMHRTDRCRQLAYAVRVALYNEPSKKQGDLMTPSVTFSRLRSGRTLAGIVRAGLRYGDVSVPSEVQQVDEVQYSRFDPVQDTGPSDIGSAFDEETQNISIDVHRRSGSISDAASLELLTSYESGDESDDGMDVEMPLTQDDNSPAKRQRNGRKIMDKIAKSVKSGTTSTGKRVVKHGKKVGETTVKAGKAIIAPMSATKVRSRKPPAAQEPKAAKAKPNAKTNRRKERGLIAVNRTLNRKKSGLGASTALAGQLSPAEQSLRTTSRALWRMSNAIAFSELATEFETVANKQFNAPSELDAFFLQGGSSQLGVEPPKNASLFHDSLVARCLWESHWREEWCGVYESGIVFFGPLGDQSSLQLSFVDVTSVRPLDSTPLAGYPVLAIETGWQCHYLAFFDVEGRALFTRKVHEQMRKCAELGIDETDNYLSKARFWQGFQASVEAALASGNHKWAKIPSGSKMKQRTILNGRRLCFDIEQFAQPTEDDELGMGTIELFVRRLVKLALSTTHQSLQTSPGKFIQFLDMTSRLRSLPLGRIDYSDPASICIFVNLYHCLLQHAMLLSINGPLQKRTVGHFLRTSCYEIGGDVFSLAEIYYCVIRGNMAKPVAPKHPYLDIPRRSTSYKFYALRFYDPRVSFILNTGDLSCPQSVAILSPELLGSILQNAAKEFVQRNLYIDKNKRLIVLPKVCDVYRHDFGSGDIMSSLRFCMPLLDITAQSDIDRLEKADPGNGLVIKFAPCNEQYHQLLTLRTESTI